MVYWNEAAKNQLNITLTCQRFYLQEDKTKIEQGVAPFSLLVLKESPDQTKWQWYPYIAIRLTFESNEVGFKTVPITKIYIMAYGIENKGTTNNILQPSFQ